MKRILLIYLMLGSALTERAQQFNINREWQQNAAHPVINPLINPAGLQWTSSVTDASGNIFTVGHTSTSTEGENIYLRKRYITGGMAFGVDENSTSNYNDYGTGIVLDGNGDIWVCGTTDNGGVTNYDALLMKFNSSGVWQFTIPYLSSSGMNDVPTSIMVTAGGDILLTVASENLTSSYDYHLVKYSSLGSMIFDTPYDYANLIDVPMGMDINTNTVVVSGASANSLIDWDYALAYFDLNTGAFISDTRTNLPGIGMNQPYAFKKDASQNIYLTGKGSTNGVDYDFFTIKVNPNYTIAWTRTLDIAGGEDAGAAVDVDVYGNVFVGGYSTNSNNVKQMSFLQYDASGNLQWQYHQESVDGTSDAFVKDLCVNTDHAYFTAGETGTSGYKEVLVGRISGAGEIKWAKSIKGNEDYTPATIQLEPDGTIITTSLRDTVVGSVYVDTKYSELAFDTSKVYNNGTPVCKQRELIVRFNRNAMNTAAVDNQIGTKIAEFGDLRDFLTTPAYAAVISALNPICPGCDVKMVKVFKDHPTTYTSTISRLGSTVPMPELWTAFTLVFPSGVDIGQAQEIFNTLPDIANYAHPNYFATFFTAPPNDTYYTPQQQCLHFVPSPINWDGPFPGTDINAEGAWDIIPSGGLPFVKGGVFDTGVRWTHQDFGYVPGNPNSTKVVNGWNFETNTLMKSGPGMAALDNHGTSVSGIIGALRNNGAGIAGIAGGNYSFPVYNKGVSLYSLRIGDIWSPNGFFNLTINYIADAIATSADNGQSPYAYGLHFTNHSWGLLPQIPLLYTDTNITLLNDAIHTANRLQVTQIAARGNTNGKETIYPAVTDDDWILTVGAYGNNGLRCDTLTWNCTQFTSYGQLDITAPGSSTLMFAPYVGSNSDYGTFGLTSGAAPHVSGVVGLLMSYFNDTVPNYKNLAPEDCEELIQRSAADKPPLGYDSLIGYGRLNAGNALQLIEKPYWDLKHFGTSSTGYTISKSVYNASDTIKLVEAFDDKNSPPNSYTRRRYVVKTFEISSTIFHNLPSTDTIKGYWARSSNSDVFELYNPVTKKLFPRERAIITSCNNTSATLKGYIYQVKDTLGNPLGWWPCDTSFSCQKLISRFEYSLLVRNSLPYVGIDKKTGNSGNEVRLYPNPASGKQELLISSGKSETVTIELFDLMGRRLRTVYSGKVQPGETVIANDVGNLPNSMYIYTIKLGDEMLNKKFIKQ